MGIRSKKGSSFFTSPFDIDSLNFAEKVGSIAYKIAAFEINNHELISEICKTDNQFLFQEECLIQEMDKVVEMFENTLVNIQSYIQYLLILLKKFTVI